MSFRTLFGLAATLVFFLAAACPVFGSAAAEQTPLWMDAPVLPEMKGGVTKRFRHDLEVSREKGLRARVFAKVGDSNTEITGVMYGLACEKAKLAGRKRAAASKRARKPRAG